MKSNQSRRNESGFTNREEKRTFMQYVSGLELYEKEDYLSSRPRFRFEIRFTSISISSIKPVQPSLLKYKAKLTSTEKDFLTTISGLIYIMAG